MNPQIRELAEQAGGNPNYKAFRGYFLPPPPDYIDPATVDLEKFAELLIRECAFVAQNKDAHKDWLKYGRGLAAGKILEHFGY